MLKCLPDHNAILNRYYRLLQIKVRGYDNDLIMFVCLSAIVLENDPGRTPDQDCMMQLEFSVKTHSRINKVELILSSLDNDIV